MVKDENGDPVSGVFRYITVLVMFLYLSGNTHSYVALAFNICVRYMFSHKLSHELALKIFVHQLKQTKYHGLLLNPYYYVCKVDACPPDNFSGMYVHEKPTDLAYVNISTGFIITFVDCYVLWDSKLQTENNLSTMEAEIILMDHCCR